MTLRRKRQSPEASPSCFRRPTTGASARRMHLWKFELITSNDVDEENYKNDDKEEDWDDDPWKRPGQAKSHIKFSFIALVTCDTHRNMWHTGLLSAESPTVAVSTTCIKWHPAQKKCTSLSLRCKISTLICKQSQGLNGHDSVSLTSSSNVQKIF